MKRRRRRNTNPIKGLLQSIQEIRKNMQGKFKRSSTQNLNTVKIRSTRARPARATNTKTLEILTSLATLTLILMIAGIIFVIAVFAYYSRFLPNPNILLQRSEELSTKLYDRTGTPIFEVYGEKNRILVTVDDVTPSVIQATLATEDATFYEHQGYSFRSMIRAFRNMLFGEGLQSGSTLTQQVVKNTLLTQERTITRKIKELILALQLENNYTKEQIIQMYLNETPYGGQNYGIYTATKAYFNKEPKDLTLAESAYLAGLPQSPSYYSQFGSNPQAGIERKNYVLYLMNERGWIGPDKKRKFISDEDYDKALKEDLQFQAAAISFEAPHFVFWAKNVLIDMFGEDVVEQGGLQVTTTLDLEMQKKAQEMVYDQVESVKTSLNLYNGALVAMDPKTGEVLSLVGSKGFFLSPEPEGCISGIAGENGCKFDPQVNVATSARQPGSSIKPITYATLLSQGYSASYPFLDVPTEFPGSSPTKPYIPVNYDGIFRGPTSLRKALGNSLNIPAIKALKIAGIDNMVDMAEKMGITTLIDRNTYGLALALGAGETKLLEMTNAFGVFAANGVFRDATPILEVKDSHGNTLYKHQDKGKKVLSEEVAFLISDILSDDGARSAAFGANSMLHIAGHQVAVKTGTTDDKRDNYALGFTPSIVVGTWVGNNNNEKMNEYVASGISGATPLWREFMLSYLANVKEPEKFSPPETVEKLKIDELTGMLPMDDFPSRDEWFIKGTEPTSRSDWFQRIEVCKDDGRIANESCKDAGKTKVNTYVKITAELPEWQYSVDQWVYENFGGDSKYYPPEMKSALEYDSSGDLDDSIDPVVEIVNIKKDSVVPMIFRLKIEVSSPNDIKRVTMYKNGEKFNEDPSAPFGYNFNFSVADIGKKVELKVVAEDSEGRKGDDKVTFEIGAY
jgi:membrane peptidoglycan carboxypeptidase